MEGQQHTFMVTSGRRDVMADQIIECDTRETALATAADMVERFALEDEINRAEHGEYRRARITQTLHRDLVFYTDRIVGVDEVRINVVRHALGISAAARKARS
jgi:hypothetical protein